MIKDDLISRKALLNSVLAHFGIDLAYLGRDLQFCQEAIALAPAVDAIALPFKIGDTVFRMLPHEDFVMECKVVEFCITERNYVIVREKLFNSRRGIDFDEIGKTLFFTREEAENAIKKRRCERWK